MKKLFSILFVLASIVAFGQPVVRIPACEFADLLETHPEVWAQKTAQLADHSRSSVGGSAEMIIAFKQNAFYTFQRCWILELQIKDIKTFQKTLLSVKVEDRELLEKQQILANEVKYRVKELESEYHVALRELQTYTVHKYGAQPILPEGWIWDNNTPQNEAINLATDKLTDLNAMIAMQEKFLGRVGNIDPEWTLEEEAKLNQFKQQRWDSILEIASLQSYKMAAGESISHGHSIDSGAN